MFRILRVEILQLLDELGSDPTVGVSELSRMSASGWASMQLKLTDAMALLSGELAFSSTMDEMDSTDDTRECPPKGR